MRSGDKMKVQVAYSDKTLLLDICPFSSIELFVDDKSVGKQSRSLGSNGEKMFSIDSAGLSKVAHSLLAKGYRGLFKSTIVSEKIQFTLESAIDPARPTPSPVASLPERGCGPNNSVAAQPNDSLPAPLQVPCPMTPPFTKMRRNYAAISNLPQWHTCRCADV
jgi:hypothetical protein